MALWWSKSRIIELVLFTELSRNVVQLRLFNVVQCQQASGQPVLPYAIVAF